MKCQKNISQRPHKLIFRALLFCRLCLPNGSVSPALSVWCCLLNRYFMFVLKCSSLVRERGGEEGSSLGGYLPEIFSMVADTPGTTGPPGMQPCKSHKPRVQLIPHSWTEATLVGRQHLWEPRVWDLDEGNGATTGGTTNIQTRALRSCHHQSLNPPFFQGGLETVTARSQPAGHSRQRRAPE